MRHKTNEERRHIAAVVALGCVICQGPAEYHHLRSGNGMGQRDHARGIPLCPCHHRQGNVGEAIHAGQRTWEKIHGTEEYLFKLVVKKINKDGENL